MSRTDVDIPASFGGSIVTGGIKYFNATSTSGPDDYINYKLSGGDRLGSGGRLRCGIIGWGYCLIWAVGNWKIIWIMKTLDDTEPY